MNKRKMSKSFLPNKSFNSLSFLHIQILLIDGNESKNFFFILIPCDAGDGSKTGGSGGAAKAQLASEIKKSAAIGSLFISAIMFAPTPRFKNAC